MRIPKDLHVELRVSDHFFFFFLALRAVHYVEAVLYGGVNPFSMPKLALHMLGFNVGPKLRQKPMYDSRICIYDYESLLRSGKLARQLESVAYGMNIH